MTTAAEFYDGAAEADDADVRPAKTIVWYDQRTPLFVCEGCHEHARPLRFEGDESAADYDLRRARAYHRLTTRSPPCDVCSGRLPEKVEP